MSTDLLAREACALCHTSRLEILIPRSVLPEQVHVLRCRDCGLVFLESRAGKDELDAEEDKYWDDGKQQQIYFQDDVQATFRKEFERRLDTLERHVGQPGHLLDVGCGVGHFLDTARRRGWTVTGLDISASASRAAQQAYSIHVEVGTLEQCHVTPGSYDAVTLWDVIEHIRRPVENVRAANRLLRPGGVLVMKTPNESGLFKQAALTLYRLFGRPAGFLLKYVYYVPHYFSYSPQTTAALLAQAGFEAITYEFDETPQDFAVAKIQAHYGFDPKRALVIALLPVARVLARLVRRTNKLVVYARKVREAGPGEAAAVPAIGKAPSRREPSACW